MPFRKEWVEKNKREFPIRLVPINFNYLNHEDLEIIVEKFGFICANSEKYGKPNHLTDRLIFIKRDDNTKFFYYLDLYSDFITIYSCPIINNDRGDIINRLYRGEILDMKDLLNKFKKYKIKEGISHLIN